MNHPRLNVYTCMLGHQTVTVDCDRGVTPFMIGCRHQGCRASAQSGFYPRGPKALELPAPTHEWVIPTEQEIASEISSGIATLKMRMAARGEVWTDDWARGLESDTRAHYRKGGLMLRPRTDRAALTDLVLPGGAA